MELIIHTDGGSRGNPGEGAVGVVIEQIANGKQQIVKKLKKKIGVVTNNEAEYRAVIFALEETKKIMSNFLLAQAGEFPASPARLAFASSKRAGRRISKLSFFLDSLLVVSQLNGLWKVKQPHIRELLLQVRSLEQDIGVPITYSHVPREENVEADLLVNQALDSAI